MTYTTQKTVTASGYYRQVVERANGDVLTPSPYTGRSVSFVASATKGENPGWRDDIRNGRCATTDLSGSDLIVHTYQPGAADFENPNATGTGVKYAWNSGMIAANHSSVPTSPSGLSSTIADNIAKTEFLNKVIAAQRSFQGGVALGELRETLQMIRNPARALRRRLDAYHGAVKERTRRLKHDNVQRVVSDTWLEYNFGWTPFVRDIQDAVEAIAKRRLRNIKIISGFGVSEDASDTTNGSVISSLGNTAVEVRSITKDQVKVKYLGAVDCSRSGTRRQLKNWGISTQDFIPTVWELIPYSFLVDYFTNIGDIINAWSWQRTGLIWSQKTTRRSRTLERMTTLDRTKLGPSLKSTNFASSISRLERTSVSRSIYEGSFVPTLGFTIPGFGSDAKKYFNIAALARLRTL